MREWCDITEGHLEAGAALLGQLLKSEGKMMVNVNALSNDLRVVFIRITQKY